jgi:RNA polymerase sigma-70 factor (ECF subfamily)
MMELARRCYARRVSGGEVADGELVARIERAGSLGREAEAELCRRFAPRARLYGLRHLRDEERARDLVQAVLLAVIVAARAGRVMDRDKVDRFVLGTCRNVAQRMRERDGRAATGELPEELAAPAAPERVDLTALMRCMGALEERARDVVLLSFNGGHGAEEIATMFAMTSGNVRVVRHRALAALRRCLDASAEGAS